MCMICGLQIIKILAATFSMMILGMIWFSSSVFGKMWAKEIGMECDGKTNRPPVKALIFTLIQTLILTSTLNMILQMTHAFHSLPRTLYVCAMIGVGISATELAGGSIWRGDSWKFFFIISGRSILALLLGGVVMYYV